MRRAISHERSGGLLLAISALAAGAVMATGQAPIGWWPLALFALAAAIALVADRDSPRSGALVAWGLGTGYFAAAMFWIVDPFLVEPEVYGWMAPFALLFLSTGLALFWAAAGGVAAYLGRDRASRALVFAVALAGVELARGHVLTGFPWALIGHVWIGSPVMQLAAWIGAVGLTAVALAVAALPVMFRLRGVLAMLLVLGLAYGAGLWLLSTPDPQRADPATIRLVQPNATQALKWEPGMQQVFFDRLMVATATTPRPDLVVWPETAVPYLLESSGELTAVIANAANGAPVALGIQRGEGERYYNSVVVLDASGGVTHTYDKVHLVPFGEYTPFGDLLADYGVTAFAARHGAGYTAGDGFTVFDFGGKLGKALPLNCYEMVFPHDLRTVPERADWILHLTNDGWFGNLTGPYQHLAQARLRAVEFGLPVLRSANTGISAVIDAKGRILDSLPLNTDGYLDAKLPAALPVTLYARTGDWPAAFVIIVALLALWMRRRRVSD